MEDAKRVLDEGFAADVGQNGYKASQVFSNPHATCGYSYDDVVLLPGTAVAQDR